MTLLAWIVVLVCDTLTKSDQVCKASLCLKGSSVGQL